MPVNKYDKEIDALYRVINTCGKQLCALNISLNKDVPGRKGFFTKVDLRTLLNIYYKVVDTAKNF